MKRHEALAPLSREHHSTLILAQLLQKDAPDYKGLPQTTKEKAIYATAFFEKELKTHFEKEEAVFGLVKMVHPEIEKMVNELVAEHRDMSSMFHSLPDTVLQNMTATMNGLGELLNNHIRKEERLLFPLIQQYCPAGLLAQVGRLLEEKN
jgi:hemerythrin-like domain-containing protein